MTDIISDRRIYIVHATGYLTDAGKTENGIHKLVIPNKEILGIYENRIRSWFKVKITSDTTRWKRFCEAIKSGNAKEVQVLFNEFMSVSISIRDTYIRKDMKENLPIGKATTKGSTGQNPSACFYHGLLLGLLRAEGSWKLKSNTEFLPMG